MYQSNNIVSNYPHIILVLKSEVKTRTSLCVLQGKTLTTIALILTNFHKGQPLPVEQCVSVAVLLFVCFCFVSLCRINSFVHMCAAGAVVTFQGQN